MASDEELARAASGPTLDELATAAGADDLFLFRRVEANRFAHIGGAGRGVGWAGIVEVGLTEEPLLAAAVAQQDVLQRSEDEAWQVFGPYYARSAAIVPLDQDLVAVFGSPRRDALALDTEELRGLARYASESVDDVTPAKRLADELEVVNAVRDLLSLKADTFEETLNAFVDHARNALSCEIGVVYVTDRQTLAISDPRELVRDDPESLVAAMASLRERREYPLCIQDAHENDLPTPFSSAEGAVSYYLLKLPHPAPGLLLLIHTREAPRGFTQLCQALGQRLVDAAGALFATALAHDAMRQDLRQAAAEARTDALTGMANRLAWDEAVAAYDQSPVASIIQLDCRGLKQTNETKGHHVGDQLLRAVALAIRDCLRDGDTYARIGGDEFAILLPDADEEAAAAVVRRIDAAISARPTIEAVPVGAAIGVATTTSGDLQTAQQEADMAMCAAKRLPEHAVRAI
jgi:diguanylate cyclase (GGDEF)-like protein